MLLKNLEEVRALIEEEVQMDIDARSMYQSPRLTDEGWAGYPALLLEAVRSHDPPWLEQQIKLRGWIKDQEQRVRNGVVHWARVPYTAAQTLAEGDFNRYYIRAVCCAAILAGNDTVLVYRAKQVENPRPESVRLTGSKLSAQKLLDDLRINSNKLETALGLPPGPNSGLSACLD